MRFTLYSICLWLLTHSADARGSRAAPHARKRWEHREQYLDESKHNEEFWTFVTRPDLDAPRWNLSIHDEAAVTAGYWFVGPYEEVEQENSSAAWNAPHIYDGSGELVWSGAPTFHGFSTFDFRVSQVQGKPMLSLIRPNLEYAVILDNSYKIYKNVDIGHTGPDFEELGLNIHEFMTTEDGNNALYLTCVPKKASKKYSAAIGFDGNCQAVYDGFVDASTDDWKPTFEWNSYGKIGLDESYVTQQPLDERCVDQKWDFLHLNSIDKFPEGDYLLSGRRTNTLYKVSGRDGSIMWRLGGKKSDFKDLPVVFSGQHAAKIHSQNDTHTLISFLDNAYGPGDPQTTNDASRGLLLAVDDKVMTVSLVQEFKHPHHDYAKGQGNLQWLDNGHAWTCWQGKALHTEHTPDGRLVMEAQFKAGVRNYRSFKYEWVGRPSQPPDVRSAALQEIDGSISTIVSVSWNGATEVHEWNIYEANPSGMERTLIDTVPRTGFETTTWLDGYFSHVVVEAVDKAGEKLGEAVVFATVPTLEQLVDFDSDPSWLETLVQHPAIPFGIGVIVSACAVIGAWGVLVARGRKEVLPRWKKDQQAYQTVSSTDMDELDDYDKTVSKDPSTDEVLQRDER